MKVDGCTKLQCLSLRAPQGPNEYLNVNGPLQVGGSAVKLSSLARAFNWTHKPTDQGYSGCVRNFTYNQRVSDSPLYYLSFFIQSCNNYVNSRTD